MAIIAVAASKYRHVHVGVPSSRVHVSMAITAVAASKDVVCSLTRKLLVVVSMAITAVAASKVEFVIKRPRPNGRVQGITAVAASKVVYR
jgi:hypothetical protein